MTKVEEYAAKLGYSRLKTGIAAYGLDDFDRRKNP